jgi:hypothetical protein
MGIAAGGYRWRSDEPTPRVAFFPGYPLAVRAAALLLNIPHEEAPWLWTGVAVSTTFLFVGLIWLQRLAREFGATDAQAGAAAWILACYPFSLFYGQFYSESLFLAAAVLAYYHVRRGRWWLGALFGVAVGLSRPPGVLVALVVGGEALRQFRRGELNTWVSLVPVIAAILAPLLGLLSYAVYLNALTSDPLAWAHAQSRWGRDLSDPVLPFAGILTFVRTAGLDSYMLLNPYDFANASAGLAALVVAVPVGRRLGWEHGVFVALGVLIPLMAGGLMSLGRFTSVLFPIFIWFATRQPSIPAGLVASFAICQGLLASLFFTDRPIF